MKLNLGCADDILPGYTNVDVFAYDDRVTVADLRKEWPWEDGTVEHIIARDFIEHLPDKIFTMNEMHRVLHNGGTVDILVPTTDGRGAFQDPTHVSFWNSNSFMYYEHGDAHNVRFAGSYGITARFKTLQAREWSSGNVTYYECLLAAVK